MSENVDPLRQVRLQHEAVVVAELARAGSMTRSELIRRTGLSRTTVFSIVADLISSETLVATPETNAGPSRRGRPRQQISINPATGRYLGVDIGRAHVHAVALDAAHRVISDGSTTYDLDEDLTRKLAAAHDLVDRISKQGSASMAGLQAIGVAMYGVIFEPSDPARSHELREPAASAEASFTQRYGVPVHLENNTRCALLAELTWGASRDRNHVLYVRCSDGISSAAAVDGRRLRGAHGLGGEIGHVQIDPAGPACHCGGHGCLELTSGLQALLATCRRAGRPVSGAAELVSAAMAGDEVVLSAVRRAVGALAEVVAQAVTQLDPAQVVFAGELSGLGDLLLDPIRDVIADRCLPRYPHEIDVVCSSLGSSSAALGAVAQLLGEETW